MLAENDADVTTTIPPTQLTYILHLSDTHTAYTRFFDALLIKRSSHRSFFNDLCGFRSQPTIVSLLSSCKTSDSAVSKDELKQKYREVTHHFLASRFAHPWCRTALSVPSTPTRPSTSGTSGTGSRTARGWWSAEWGSTGRKISKKDAEEELRLHKLLVPIWIAMRARMFPGDHVIQRWWKTKKEDEDRIRKVRGMEMEMRRELEREREHERVDSNKVTKWLEKLDTDNFDVVDSEIPIDHHNDDDDDDNDNNNNNDMEEVDFELSPTSTLSVLTPSSSTTTLNDMNTLADNFNLNLNPKLSNEQNILTSPLITQSIPAITITNTAANTDTTTKSKTKATPDHILHQLRSTKTTPDLRDSFWSSPEARGLKQDLHKREQQQQKQPRRPKTGHSNGARNKHNYRYYVPGYDSEDDVDCCYGCGSESVHEGDAHVSAATGLMKIAAVGMMLTTVPKWKAKRLMKRMS